MTSVLQSWTEDLTLMQQSVLISCVRGPDGIRKDHQSKKLLRYLRRCTLRFAFGGIVRWFPHDPEGPEGGSFTGASIGYSHGAFFFTTDLGNIVTVNTWTEAMSGVVSSYLSTTDEIPHHFQLHFLHAVEILGYKFPLIEVRDWWHYTYLRLVNDMHLEPESEETMDRRLGDDEQNWRAAEEVTAR